MYREMRRITAALALVAALLPTQGPAQQSSTPQASAAECALDPTEIYARTEKSILKVLTLHIDPMLLLGRVQAGSGSAIALGNGQFVTNYHVVGKSEEVMLVAGEEFLPALVVGRDPALDIAVLYSPFDEMIGLSERMPFAPDSEPLPGQRVYAIGFPMGAARSINGGMISAVERFLPLNTSSWTTRYIQTDAAISPGSSGGALVDECGRLIGMVTLKSSVPGVENIGYALPLATLDNLLPQLKETGHVARAWHGLYGQMVTPLILALLGADPMAEVTGFLVETVEPGSAADKAGIRGGQVPVLWGMGEFILGGDIITHVNDRPIRLIQDAIEIVDSLKVGDRVSIDFLRDGEAKSATVTLEERPVFESDAFLLTPENR
jgi:putative serine protease PepD